MIIFYDPGCDECKAILPTIADDTLLKKRIEEGKLQMIAIYTGEEKQPCIIICSRIRNLQRGG